jgi:predicted dehydrogenase
MLNSLSSKNLRVAVISSTGSGFKRIIPALVDSHLVKVTAVHGRDRLRLKQLAESYNIPCVYTDLDSLLGEHHFDFAVVCSPPFMHLDQVSKLISARIPCLVEKPLSLDSSSISYLGDLAKAHGVHLRVAHHLRHTPMFKIVKSLIGAGGIGTPHAAFMEWSFLLNPKSKNAAWKLNPALNGATSLSDAGIHCIDIAVALFGPGHVKCAFSRSQANHGTVEDVIGISSHSDVMVSIAASRLYGPYSNDLRIVGSQAELFVPGFFGEQGATEGFVRSVGKVDKVSCEKVNPYAKEVEDFARLITGEDSHLLTTVEDALDSVIIIEQVCRLIGIYQVQPFDIS